ncbi:hypothetical protein LTS18_005781, partial [Coniosporium uncinatum]
SCISEAQKYQGALYKDKNRSKPHSRNNSKNEHSQQALVRHAYVEDVPDADTGAVAIVDAPPPAPSPPPAVNVFDFLVGEETANETQEAITPEDSRYIENIRVDGDEDADMDRYPNEHDNGYREEYIEYGADPLQPSFE